VPNVYYKYCYQCVKYIFNYRIVCILIVVINLCVIDILTVFEDFIQYLAACRK
jgi:hypothetical protein